MTDNEPIQTSESEQELAYLRAEVEHLRRRLGSEGSTDSRLSELESKLAATSSQNERLTSTLREARDQIVSLKEEVDRLAQPPTGFGTFLQRNDDESVDVRWWPLDDLPDLTDRERVCIQRALAPGTTTAFARS